MVSWYLQRHIKVQEKHISLYEGQATPQNKALKIPSFWLKRWLSAYLDGVFVETNSFLSDPSSIIVVTFFSLTLDWGDSGWWGCPIDVVADVVDNLMTADSLTTALSQIDHNLDCLVTSYIFFSWPNSLTSYNLP